MAHVEGTVLVTGGTGALGTAAVGTLLEDGCHVVTTWIVPAHKDELLKELGDRDTLELVEADLTDSGAVDAVIERAIAGPAPLAAAVNLVGGYSGGARLHESDDGDLDRMLRLNLRPTYLVTRTVLPHLLKQGGGSIVTVSAKAAVQPLAGAAGYITAKAAVLAFTRAVAADYRDDGIRANAILPSVIDTPQNRRNMPGADHSRWVPPGYIARLIRFLCSPDSAEITGAAIPIYGRS